MKEDIDGLQIENCKVNAINGDTDEKSSGSNELLGPLALKIQC